MASFDSTRNVFSEVTCLQASIGSFITLREEINVSKAKEDIEKILKDNLTFPKVPELLEELQGVDAKDHKTNVETLQKIVSKAKEILSSNQEESLSQSSEERPAKRPKVEASTKLSLEEIDAALDPKKVKEIYKQRTDICLKKIIETIEQITRSNVQKIIGTGTELRELQARVQLIKSNIENNLSVSQEDYKYLEERQQAIYNRAFSLSSSSGLQPSSRANILPNRIRTPAEEARDFELELALARLEAKLSNTMDALLAAYDHARNVNIYDKALYDKALSDALEEGNVALYGREGMLTLLLIDFLRGKERIKIDELPEVFLHQFNQVKMLAKLLKGIKSDFASKVILGNKELEKDEVECAKLIQSIVKDANLQDVDSRYLLNNILSNHFNKLPTNQSDLLNQYYLWLQNNIKNLENDQVRRDDLWTTCITLARKVIPIEESRFVWVNSAEERRLCISAVGHIYLARTISSKMPDPSASNANGLLCHQHLRRAEKLLFRINNVGENELTELLLKQYLYCKNYRAAFGVAKSAKQSSPYIGAKQFTLVLEACIKDFQWSLAKKVAKELIPCILSNPSYYAMNEYAISVKAGRTALSLLLQHYFSKQKWKEVDEMLEAMHKAYADENMKDPVLYLALHSYISSKDVTMLINLDYKKIEFYLDQLKNVPLELLPILATFYLIHGLQDKYDRLELKMELKTLCIYDIVKHFLDKNDNEKAEHFFKKVDYWTHQTSGLNEILQICKSKGNKSLFRIYFAHRVQPSTLGLPWKDIYPLDFFASYAREYNEEDLFWEQAVLYFISTESFNLAKECITKIQSSEMQEDLQAQVSHAINDSVL